MAHVHIEGIIHAPIQKVFDFLADPNKVPLVMTGLIENSNVPELPLRAGHSFHYKYQMYGVMLEGEWTVTALESPHLYNATTSPDQSQWHYELREVPEGTSVLLTISYEPPQTVVQKARTELLERLNQQEAEAYMKNLQAALELEEAA